MSYLRRLLLVRHGLPDYRSGKAGDVPPGPPLSELGHVQARQTAAALRRFRLQTIYSSPLARAWQTAQGLHQTLHVPLVVCADLTEWHHTELLYDVSVRNARWLARWLAGDEECAAVVGHASPLLAILRSALYLPHARWHRPGHPEQLLLNTADRFEVSMASVFALTFTPDEVCAELIFHPQPRIVDASRRLRRRTLPRPVVGHGENHCVYRPNLTRLIGAPPPPEP
jgi:broad specificity phosphatase PhoE